MPLSAGARLGPYEILELIGRGGMGEVYRARDERLERDVAVKILPEHLSAHVESLKRFRREAKAVAALSHPNIVALFDIGDAPDGPYVVTELLDGETLRTRLLRGPLPIGEVLRIAHAIAGGLGAAHTKGIIHRDLKPENIFLTVDGAVKILDFGLASTQRPVAGAPESLAANEPLTEPGLVIGTIGYMSPEQLRGRPLTTACDLFALGCVTYEMARGQMPFQRDSSLEVIASVLRDEPFARDSGGLPSELRAVIGRCLEKSPEKRYQTGSEVAAALREVLARHDEGHLSTMKTVRLPPVRRPWRMAAVAVALLALLATAGVSWSRLRAQRQVVDGGYDLRAGDISGSADTRRLMTLALRADAAGDRSEAIELCREAARLDTRAPLPAAFLASFTWYNGDPKEGARWSEEAKRRLGGATSSTYETLLSRYLVPNIDNAQSMALSSSMLALRPSAWRLRLSLAHRHMDRRELPAMLAELKRIDVAGPDDRRLALVLADRAALGDTTAIADLQRSRLVQRPPLLAYTRGRIAWSGGHPDEAVRQYDLAAEGATLSNLPSIAIDSRVLGGVASVGTGNLERAEQAFDMAAVKAHQAGLPQLELESDIFGAYVAYRLGDHDGMERRLRAAAPLADPGSSTFASFQLLLWRFGLHIPFPKLTPEPQAGEVHDGLETLLAAREAWSRGDDATAGRLLRQARSEGADGAWFAEEAALLDYDLGAPPRTFRADPPYPNRLRFIAIWELGRERVARPR
jgi:hypothetical protein